MKKLVSIPILLSVVLSFSLCKKAESSSGTGKIVFTVGSVHIQRGEEKLSVSVSDELKEGDVLVTGEKSLATVAIGEEASIIEIQSGSRFRVDSLKQDKVFTQEEGRSWILVRKLGKGEGLSLVTPTTTAGVRGTKFYANIYDGMSFICHCEGKVELENKEDHSRMSPDGDYLTVTKGSKTIVITQKDLQKIDIPYIHDHSEVANSKLGGENRMSMADYFKIVDLAKKKLAEKP